MFFGDEVLTREFKCSCCRGIDRSKRTCREAISFLFSLKKDLISD